MSAIPDVEILAADRAQSSAIGLAGRIDGNLQQCILANERLKVNLGIFWNYEPGFADALLIEGKELGHGPSQVLIEGLEAAAALELRPGGELASEKQSLGCPADIEQARQVPDLEIGAQNDPINVEWELVGVADFLVHDEADIEAQWLARVAQGNLSYRSCLP